MKKAMFGALCALAVLTTGCTGSFHLTQVIHSWHRGFENPWTDELCYLLSFLVIYPCTITLDTIFLNSIEFWVGENPIVLSSDGAVVTRVDDHTATVETLAGAKYTLTRNVDGTLTLTDAQGNSCRSTLSGDVVAI